MGCGNSAATNTTGGQPESSKEIIEDSIEDEKRKNYGGVYVGLPTDFSNMPPVHIGSTLKGTEQGNENLREPLWGNKLRS